MQIKVKRYKADNGCDIQWHKMFGFGEADEQERKESEDGFQRPHGKAREGSRVAKGMMMFVEREEKAGVQEAVFPVGERIDCYNAQIHFENDHPPGQSHFLQGEGKARWKAEAIEAHGPGRHAGHYEHGAGGSKSFAAYGRCGTPYSLYPFAVSFRKKIERIATTHERNDYAEEDFGHACVKHLR